MGSAGRAATGVLAISYRPRNYQLFRMLRLLLPLCCGFVAGRTSISSRIYRAVADVAGQGEG
jgi:hypothetical protein